MDPRKDAVDDLGDSPRELDDLRDLLVEPCDITYFNHNLLPTLITIKIYFKLFLSTSYNIVLQKKFCLQRKESL